VEVTVPDRSIDPTDASTWPDVCPDCGNAITVTRQCMGHRTSDGVHCGNKALKGQVVCRKHGGAAKQARAKASERIEEARAKRTIEQALAKIDRDSLGVVEAIEPLDALLLALYRTAAFAGVLHSVLSSADLDELTQWGATGKQLSVFAELYMRLTEQQARIASACLKAGVEERSVRLAEGQAELMASVLREFAKRCGLDLASPEVAAAARASLTLVEGRAA
jgi:hypothetical protein